MVLSLLVLIVDKLAECTAFYSKLGMKFVEEQHDDGPIHFSCVLGGVVFELYPCKTGEQPSNNRIGFHLDQSESNSSARIGWLEANASSSYINDFGEKIYVLTDPENRKVEIGFRR